jgi:hypothetical protein
MEEEKENGERTREQWRPRETIEAERHCRPLEEKVGSGLGEEEARGLEEKVGSGLGMRRDNRLGGRRLGFHCLLALLYDEVTKMN